jgi:hypothetical protein
VNSELKRVIDRVETWPQEVQEEAVEILLAIERGHSARYRLSEDDRAALARSAQDVREGRFVPDEQVTEFFERNRRP